MSVAGRQLYPQAPSFQGFRQSIAARRPRALTHRQQPRTRNVAVLCATDASLAQDSSGAIPSQSRKREAILLQRFKAHESAITATLVLNDAGTLSPLQLINKVILHLPLS